MSRMSTLFRVCSHHKTPYYPYFHGIKAAAAVAAGGHPAQRSTWGDQGRVGTNTTELPHFYRGPMAGKQCTKLTNRSQVVVVTDQ